jgi:glycosyltransferase involved in cell wall biosynthesis
MMVEDNSESAQRQPATAKPVVLQVVPALVTGGVERGTVDMAVAMAEAGWTSLVVSSGGPMVREIERAGAKHILLPAIRSRNPFTIGANIDKLVEIIRRFNVDIVHARSRAPAWAAEAAAKRTGAHFVTTFHGTYNLGPMALKRHYNAVMTRGERVIAISEFIARHIHQYYGVGWERVRVVHRGIDFDKFDPLHVSPERIIQLSTAWRLPDGMPVIILPGRLTRWKGQTVMIEAIAQLKRRDVRCLLVGSDQGRTEFKAELEALVRRHGLDDIVHIVGDCNDLPAAYMLSDVVVSASTDPEAFGRVIVEAQAMGRPIVASDHGGARETILEGKTGWLVAPGDPGALAQAIETVLGLGPEKREKVAELAVQHARAHFSKEQMCQATLAVYREVLGGGKET